MKHNTEKKELNLKLKHLLNEWNVPDIQADKLIFEMFKVYEKDLLQSRKELIERIKKMKEIYEDDSITFELDAKNKIIDKVINLLEKDGE